MRGGSVVLATSPYRVDMTRTLSAARQDSGLADWLAGYGIDIGESMVLDPQNAALPVPTERMVGGLPRSEEHTSELQSLMRISYAVFCLKKNTHATISTHHQYHTHCSMTQSQQRRHQH